MTAHSSSLTSSCTFMPPTGQGRCHGCETTSNTDSVLFVLLDFSAGLIRDQLQHPKQDYRAGIGITRRASASCARAAPGPRARRS